MDLTYRIDTEEDVDIISFNGHINEDAEIALAGLKEQLNKDCVFNLKEIKSINSCGVRAWINFIRDVDKSRTIIFEECPPEVVSQINMIPNFKGNSKIRSVYSSYVCDNCDFQKLELFQEGKNLPKNSEAQVPQVQCPRCGSIMEMEELEEEFFGWLDSD
ncbi:MAG: hypothetical protein HRU09_10105 [Oligoflexales bacterium]|nr:hypothetical protein [Oligoflexales bacterium]